jgi:hypothetical protein
MLGFMFEGFEKRPPWGLKQPENQDADPSTGDRRRHFSTVPRHRFAAGGPITKTFQIWGKNTNVNLLLTT